MTAVVRTRGQEVPMTAADWNDHFIKKLQEEIAQQEQLVRRMIVRGAPSQVIDKLIAAPAPRAGT